MPTIAITIDTSPSALLGDGEEPAGGLTSELVQDYLGRVQEAAEAIAPSGWGVEVEGHHGTVYDTVRLVPSDEDDDTQEDVIMDGDRIREEVSYAIGQAWEAWGAALPCCASGNASLASIRALRSEAAEAGDMEQVAICDLALDGDETAAAECRRVIEDATLGRITRLVKP